MIRILHVIWSLVMCILLCSNVQANNKLALDAYGALWSGNYKVSHEAFELLIEETDGQNSEYYLQCGIAYYHQLMWVEAISSLEKATSLRNTEAHLWLARAYSVQDDKYKTLLNLEHYLKNTEQPDIKNIKKDTLFRKLHNTERWLELWQTDWFSDGEKFSEEVHWYLNKGNVAEAHRLLENVEGGICEAQQLHALHAEVYAYEENWQMALYEINRAIKLEVSREYLKQKINYLQQDEQLGEAVKVLGTLLETDTYDFDSRYQRAQLAYQSGEYELAREELDICLAYIQTTETLLLSGKIYRAMGSYLNALRCFNPLLEQDSTNAAVLAARGITYYNTKTYKSAAYDLSMSLDLEPNDAEANYYMGLTQKALGNSNEACFYFKRALKQGEDRAREYLETTCSP